MLPAVVIGAVAVCILAMNIGTPEIFTAVTSVAVIMIYLAYLLVTVPMLISRMQGTVAHGRCAEGLLLSGQAGACR